MKKPFPSHEPHSLLLVRFSSMGDILHVLPAFRALRKKLRITRLFWAVDNAFADIVEGQDGLKEILPFERHETAKRLGALTTFWSGISMVWHYIKELRSRKIVGSLDFHGNFRSGFFAWFSGARRRLAFSSWSEGNRIFQDCAFKAPKAKLHAIERNLALIKHMGIDAEPECVPVAVGSDKRATIDKYLKEQQLEQKRYILMFPTSTWTIKQWTVEGYAETASEINKATGLPVLIVQDLKGAETAEAIAAISKGKIKVTPFFGIKELAALCENAAFAIGCDTGPLHLAAAMGTPVVGIYGPTDPAVFGPYWKPNRVVMHDENCTRRCWKHRRSEDEACQCLKALKAEKVIKACLELYAETSTAQEKARRSA